MMTVSYVIIHGVKYVLLAGVWTALVKKGREDRIHVICKVSEIKEATPK